MYKRIIGFFILILVSAPGFSQSIFGKWKSIDDETGEAKSIVEIYQSGEKLEGKIISLINPPPDDPDPVCSECPKDDERYMEKVIGMVIIRDMAPDGDEFAGGTVLKPDEGRVYKCRIWLDEDQLKVRGYWGPFYRTQTWIRAN